VLRFLHLPSFASSFVHQAFAPWDAISAGHSSTRAANSIHGLPSARSLPNWGLRWPSHRRMLTADAALSLRPLDELMDGREREMKEGCQTDKARPVVGLSQCHSMSTAGTTAYTMSFNAYVESGNCLGSAMRTHLRVASTKRTHNPRDGYRISCLCSLVKVIAAERQKGAALIQDACAR
jgi:hypothetical protein